jgi:4'-phosphopantetheinyl transferase
VPDFPPTPPGPPGGGSPGIDLSGTVVVLLTERARTRAGDHRMLIDLVGRLTGVAPAAIVLDQVCPNCGEPGHGPFRVGFGAAPDAAPTVHVSLARADGRLAVAVTAAGPVGIDLESIAGLGRAPVAGVILSDTEARALADLDPGAAEEAVAMIWTVKEAVLKAAGVGLRVDPRGLTVALAPPHGPVSAGPVLADWPAAPFPPGRAHLLPLAASAGFVGTVAVVCAERPVLRMLPGPLR